METRKGTRVIWLALSPVSYIWSRTWSITRRRCCGRKHVMALLLVSVLTIYVLSHKPLVGPGDWNTSHVSGTEVRHLVFLKVHKVASTTMMNVFMRFGITRNLTIMIPRKLNTFSQSGTLKPSQFLHYSPTGTYDILCCHVVYNRPAIARYFHPDTRYIGIVRHPLEQFLSAFNYYGYMKYLKRIPGGNRISTFLKDPEKYEPSFPGSSFTNNRMSFDFGYPSAKFNNTSNMRVYLKQLESEFDFVMVVEYFDESLLMLKRMLGWTMQDIVYVPKKYGKRKITLNLTEEDRTRHQIWAKLDYMLYDKFLEIFIDRLKKQDSLFFEELKTSKYIRHRVKQFCSKKTSRTYTVEETRWNKLFVVTRQDCHYMKMGPIKLIQAFRERYETAVSNR